MRFVSNGSGLGLGLGLGLDLHMCLTHLRFFERGEKILREKEAKEG